MQEIDLIEPVWLARDCLAPRHWFPRGHRDSACGRSHNQSRMGEFKGQRICERCRRAMWREWQGKRT